MEKKNSYRSDKALGVIYNKVAHRTVEFNPVWDSPFDERITKRFELDNDTLKKARKIKAEYDAAVRRVLSQHALKTEFELYAGFALTKPSVGSDYNFREDLDREFRSLKEHYQDVCIKAAGGKNAENLEPFVAAMYTITEEQIKTALFEHNRGPINDAGTIMQPRKLEPRSMPLISFPWIFYGVMCRIATDGAVDPKTNIGTFRATQQSFIQDIMVAQNPSPVREAQPINVGSVPEEVAPVEEGEKMTDGEKTAGGEKATDGEKEPSGSGRVLEEDVSDEAQDSIDSQQDEELEEDDAIDRLDDLIDG
jgi:RNA-dependent RNA polymerase